MKDQTTATDPVIRYNLCALQLLIGERCLSALRDSPLQATAAMTNVYE